MENQGKKLVKAERPRRGRPTGQNRVPLNLEQRRARNALYEKERREEAAKAMTQLAVEIGCDPNMVQTDLLASVISFISARTACEDLDTLRSCNERLMEQIADCELRLSSPDNNVKRKRKEIDTSSDLPYTRPVKIYREERQPEFNVVVTEMNSPVSYSSGSDSNDILCAEIDDLDSLIPSIMSATSAEMNSISHLSLEDLIEQYL